MKTDFSEGESSKDLDMLLRQQNNVKIDYVKGEKPTKEKKTEREKRQREKKDARLNIQRRAKTTGTCI